MSIIIKILQKVLVNHFYKVNAGFFIFIFFIFFGVPASPVLFHLSIITAIITSPLMLGIVFVLWLLYNFKCIDYTIAQIHEPRQLFLFCLNSMPKAKRYLYMLYVHITLYLPALIYSTVICLVAAKRNLWLVIVEIVFFNIAILASSAYLYVISLQRTKSNNTRTWPGMHLSFAKPFFSIPLYHLWHAKKQMLFVSKVFSLLFLYGFIRLYEPEQYDIRPQLLAMLVIGAAHSALIFQMRAFEDEFLGFTKNLPLTISRRFLTAFCGYSLLLLPEFICLWKGFGIHFSLADYPQVILFTLGLLLLFHVTLLMDDMNMDQFIRVVFGILAGLFFIIMYNPGLTLSCALLVLSYIFLASYYYHYEKKY